MSIFKVIGRRFSLLLSLVPFLFAAVCIAQTVTPIPVVPGVTVIPSGPLTKAASAYYTKLEYSANFIEEKLSVRKWDWNIPQESQKKQTTAKGAELDLVQALRVAGAVPASVLCADSLNGAFTQLQGAISHFETADFKKRHGEDPSEDEAEGHRFAQVCREVLHDVLVCGQVALGGSINIQKEKPKTPFKFVVSVQKVQEKREKGKPVLKPKKKFDDGCPCPQFPLERKTSWILRTEKRPPSPRSWNSLSNLNLYPRFYYHGSKNPHSLEETAGHLGISIPKLKGMTNIQLAKYKVEVVPHYRELFYRYYPELQPFRDEKCFEVHHSIEQQVLEMYPEAFSAEELHDICNLRGICGTARAWLHRGIILEEWKAFYLEHHFFVTREQILEKAKYIDQICGDYYHPYGWRYSVYFTEPSERPCRH